MSETGNITPPVKYPELFEAFAEFSARIKALFEERLRCKDLEIDALKLNLAAYGEMINRQAEALKLSEEAFRYLLNDDYGCFCSYDDKLQAQDFKEPGEYHTPACIKARAAVEAIKRVYIRKEGK